MTEFKSYAQEGNFKRNLREVPDEVAKMQREAADQRQARVSVEEFRAKSAEIYRRAQENAGVIEANQNKIVFNQEQNTKKAHIKAVQDNYRIELENNEARAADKLRDFQQLQAFSKTAISFTAQILEKQALDRKKAASLAAYSHGFDMQTLKDVNQLNDGLTYAQYQQTDLFRQFKKDGKSDSYIQAVYDDVYQHRGSKRWVENVAILQNHAASYPNIVNTFLDNNPNLSADEKLSALNNLRSEFISETNINGKLVSAEVLGQHVFPTLRKVDAAIQLKLQGERSKQRDLMLDADTMRGWEVALGPDQANVEALHQALSMNPSFEKRTLFANWLTNSIRSGNINSETGTAIFNHPIEKDGQRIPWSQAFGGTAEAAQIFEELNALRRQESTRLQENLERENADKNIKMTTAINEVLADGLYTQEEEKRIQAIHNQVYGVGQSSPALEELSKYTTDTRAKEQRSQIIESMIATNSWTVERAANMKLTFDEHSKYMGFAIRQSQVLKSPQRGIYHERLEALVTGDPETMFSPNSTQKNASHIWQMEQLRRQFDAELKKQLLANPNITIASEAAFATVDQAFKQRQKTNYVDKDGNYLDYQSFLATGRKAAQIGRARYESIQQLKADNSPPEKIVEVIGEELVMDAYEAVAKPGAVASEQWKQLADIYGKDPLTMINMLAPVIGKDVIDPSSFELGRLKANMSPIDQFTLDSFKTEERRARVLRKAMGETYAAPRRGVHAAGLPVEGGALTGLTDTDFRDLAFIVSGEAARDTDDEFMVAASIINRYAQGGFGDTIAEIGSGPDQYIAVQDGLARHEPALMQRLMSAEGQAKIVSALQILQGRQDFRGQDLLHNRHESDPMAHESGNYFLYSGQTPGSGTYTGPINRSYERFIAK